MGLMVTARKIWAFLGTLPGWAYGAIAAGVGLALAYFTGRASGSHKGSGEVVKATRRQEADQAVNDADEDATYQAIEDRDITLEERLSDHPTTLDATSSRNDSLGKRLARVEVRKHKP